VIDQTLPYTIRPMEPEDVPTVAAIERLSFPTPWPMASFLYELSHPERSYYHVLLKPETDRTAPSERGWRRWLRGAVGLPGESPVIGYVGFRRRSAEAHISTIAVHPDWRGKGLGELLLLTALEKGLALGAHVVSLEVRASNQVAQNLYRKYGFRFAGVHGGYYRDGEDAWLMKAEVHRDAYQARLARMRRTLEERLRGREAHVGQNEWDRI
jgi:ribosomal-protein-alanine N-acetyltransferase